MAAQEQAIRRNAIKSKIDKNRVESKCRLCVKVDETVSHRVCECPMLAQREYKRRHDWVGIKVHWEVYRKNGFNVNEKGINMGQRKERKIIVGRYYEILHNKLIKSLRQEDLIW